MKIFVILACLCVSIYSQHVLSFNSDTIGANTTDKSLADSLYNYAVSKLNFLDYNDCNNCALRAHLLTFLFSQRYPDLKTGKVWIFADSKLSSKRDYYKTHTKEYLSYKNMCPLWGFHVAPVLIFGNDTIVIDPSTQTKPGKLSDWASNISTQTSSYVIVKKNDFYSYPEDSYDLFDESREWEIKQNSGSVEKEIEFLSQKLTLAYHNFYDAVRFNYYKKKLSVLMNPQ